MDEEEKFPMCQSNSSNDIDNNYIESDYIIEGTGILTSNRIFNSDDDMYDNKINL